MQRLFLIFLAPLALAGCISVTREEPPPAPSATVVIPQGTNAVCSNGMQPPC